MLIKGEEKRGFSLNQGKSADQIRFFPTEVCAGDFHQRAVTVVEFGSRPAKRARLLSDKDSSVKKDQVSSICARGLAQGDFLEKSDGDVGRIPQGYQADEPTSEGNSGVTNELRSKCAGLKVVSSVHPSEHMEKRGNIKVPSEQILGGQDYEKTSLLNHGNIDRDAGSTKLLIQQVADDTVSSSDDDSLFVIQVRSPKSKQLLHGQKQDIDQEKLLSRAGAASSETTRKQDCRDNSETLLHYREGGVSVGYCPYKSVIAEDDRKTKVDSEEVDSSAEVSNIILAGVDSKLDTCRGADDRLVSTLATDLRSKKVGGSKYDQQVEELLRISSDADADEPISCGTKSLGGKVQSEGAVRLDHGDQLDKVNQNAPATREPEDECCEEPGVNLSEISKDYAQARKRSSTTNIATTGGVALLQDNGGSCRSGDALQDSVSPCRLGDRLQVEGEDPPGEPIIKHYVRRPHSRANSHGPADMTEKSSAEDPGVNSPEIPKVYVRTRKQSSATQVATVGPAALQENDGSFKSEDPLHRFHLEGGDPLGENIIKHYVRRPHSRANSHGPGDMTEKSSGLMMTSATNVSACSPQAEHHKDLPARLETEGILSVFQRRSKTNSSQQDLHKNENVVLQKEVIRKRSAEACYVQADHQPRWLPEGWTLEIRTREGKKTPARIRDKYYHDQKSGHRFRSRNEVLQFLDSERLARDRMAPDGMDTRVQLQDEKNLPLPISPAEHIGFQSSLSKSPLITQRIFGSLAAPSPSFSHLHLHPAYMKTRPVRPISAVSTEANRAAMTLGYVEGPNGPIQLPWGPRGEEVAAGTGQGFQGVKSLKNAAASAFDGGAANSSRVLKSSEGDRLPTASPVPAVESPGDHGEKENRGKLILRLKRKQPDSDVGKGKSKRPTYEVVHVERPPLFTSTPPQQEKITLRERTGPDVPSIPVEPSSVEDITYERPLPIASGQPTSMKHRLGNDTVSNHWGINQNPQQPEVLQQEPYTALGIPATALTSGLQTIASYSANHTHVFLDPVENTIPLSWQYPFTTQVTTSLPTFGPFPSVKFPTVASTFSIATTVPIPIFEHFPGVSSSRHVNAATTVLPCSENRSRDCISDVELADCGPQSHKALTAPRLLTKVENSKLLLGLGRRLCKQAGLEPKPKDWSRQSRPLAIGLEPGKVSLESR
ncbi:hypothetical protein M758_11G093400 [Ceratodon purpureus]|nr:hypothetical protein M758_11G093400 [Ceratodon purpureus]